jgi:spermidine/putrescine transport system substrate-binding protein
MKSNITTALSAAFALLAAATPLAAEDAKAESPAPAKQEELNLYIWAEYIDPNIITEFEKKNNCKVIISLYESNEEMMAKLQAGGASQYDLVVPSDFIMNSLIKLNLLKELDHAQIPNMANIKDNMVSPPYDQGNKFSVPYQWGTVGIVYDKTKFKEPVTSWESILKAPADTKFMFFDSEREMIGGALRYLGYSVNSMDKKELMKAADLMIAGKKSAGFMGFEANVGGLNKVVAGTVDIAVCYNGDALRSMADHPNIAFCIPKEGTVVWTDNLCIPKDAPNPKLAMKFMNYILDAQVGAKLSNFNQYATPNKASLPFITPDDLANPAIYPDATVEKRLEYVQEMSGGSAVYGELWKIVKTR